MNKNTDETVEETTENKSQEEEVSEESVESNEGDDSKETEENIDWEARALKAEKLIEKNKAKVKKDKEKPANDGSDVTLARLETRGIMESEDQEYVLRFAKSEGVSPIEALQDPIVADRLKANEKARKSDGANPSGNNRGRGAQDEVDIAVKKYKKDGTLPENNPSLTVKILNKLKNEQ